MRILLVNRWYPIGGVGNYVRILSSALADLGHSVSVIASSQYRHLPQPKADSRITVHTIPYPITPYHIRRLPGARAYHRTVETLAYALRVEQMRRRLEQHEGKYDIVEYAEVNAEGLFHPSKETPFVVKLHMPVFLFQDVFSIGLGYSTFWIARWERHFIQRAAGVLSPSRDLAKRVAAWCKIDSDRIELVPNPINLNEFYPSPKPKSENVRVLFVGNLNYNKGAFLMAQAIPTLVKRCPHIRVTFVGQNDTLPSGEKGDMHIHSIVGSAYADKIDFAGYVGHDTLVRLIRESDICVTPSYYENCPYSSLEVMACGRPLVAAWNSGFIEMIRDGETGLLFETGSADDLAEKILCLANDLSLGDVMGQKAHEWVRTHYAAPMIAEEQVRYYNRIINGIRIGEEQNSLVFPLAKE